MIFVGSGIDNSFKIRKGVEENRASSEFDTAMGRLVAFGGELVYSGAFDAPYGSGILLKNAGRPIPLAVLSTRSVTGVCDAYSGTTDDAGTGIALTIGETYAPNGLQNAGGLVLDHTGNVVRNSSNVVVLGTGNAGNAGGDGSAGTSTELRYPSAIADMGGNKYLVADSGNDRVLLYDGSVATTLVGPDSGMRHPNSIATDGTDVRIGESGRIFGILGNPVINGSALSGSFVSDAAFTFDTVKITLGSTRTPPADFTKYAFDFVPAGGTATVAAKTATVSFSGATFSYSVGALAKVNVASIAAPAVPYGWHQATVQYFLSGVLKYSRTLPYFVSTDADPLTLDDDTFEVSGTGLTYPSDLHFSSGVFAYGDLSDYNGLPNRAAWATTVRSTRLVDDFKTDSDGKTLTVRYSEYLRYDCLGGNHVKRERVFKIPLK